MALSPSITLSLSLFLPLPRAELSVCGLVVTGLTTLCQCCQLWARSICHIIMHRHCILPNSKKASPSKRKCAKQQIISKVLERQMKLKYARFVFPGYWHHCLVPLFGLYDLLVL